MDAQEPVRMAGRSYVQEMIRCGKPGCRRCPHGPYWYEYSSLGAYRKKRYVGKRLPEHLVLGAGTSAPAPKIEMAPVPPPAITANWEFVLGLAAGCARETARKRVFNLLSKARRTSPAPDADCRWLEHCWERYCQQRGWPPPVRVKTLA